MKIRKWWIVLVVIGIFTSASILIVKPGDNNKIEFKSTLRWDLREEKVNSKLEEVVKSIAAYSNGEGTTLLIGVDDEGNILGQEYDFKSLRKHGGLF